MVLVLVLVGLRSSAFFTKAGPNLDRDHAQSFGLGSAFFKKAAPNVARHRGHCSGSGSGWTPFFFCWIEEGRRRSQDRALDLGSAHEEILLRGQRSTRPWALAV